ncbi:hypothetical protein HOS76_gp39 [Pseudomonas phage Henninger]|uniref:Uncharacterized protein n=1 Tax=Pseudomonas phage Henninger TaxID=2079287 RepID=A0A2K9VHB2_9CAUD|nr:hypothetical protein HOS76_gp39 [Pseudomonas phage Henninger]AUV61733.1 hypothetical protein PsPhHenninger_gp14 [Pseudomonas phage Henninger]
MNHSDIRKHLKMGELAVTVLETLGYSYVVNEREHPHWKAPENPQDALKEALEALIKDGIEKGVAAQLDAFKNDPEKGPNWHLVAGLEGSKFQIRPENIPLTHELRDYGRIHFTGKNYTAKRIEYKRVEPGKYTGYVVVFDFQMRPYSFFTEQRLPLSCAAFQQ